MLANFDVHGIRVGIMTNGHIGKGVVEFSLVPTGLEPQEAIGLPDNPPKRPRGAASNAAPNFLAQMHQARSTTLLLSKSEARAIASALMGAAAEL